MVKTLISSHYAITSKNYMILDHISWFVEAKKLNKNCMNKTIGLFCHLLVRKYKLFLLNLNGYKFYAYSKKTKSNQMALNQAMNV